MTLVRAISATGGVSSTVFGYGYTHTWVDPAEQLVIVLFSPSGASGAPSGHAARLRCSVQCGSSSAPTG